jgi:hypothetical protein
VELRNRRTDEQGTANVEVVPSVHPFSRIAACLKTGRNDKTEELLKSSFFVHLFDIPSLISILTLTFPLSSVSATGKTQGP